jgi:hypothetical protein
MKFHLHKSKFLSYFRLCLLMCLIVMVSCFLLLIFKQISNTNNETVLVTYLDIKKQLLLGVLVESVCTVMK